MSQKKIIVTPAQSLAINKVLRADTNEIPLEDLITLVQDAGQVERWVAEKFSSAWRWNHRNNDNDQDVTVVEKKQEQFYVATPLPRKTTAGTTDPAAGNGKVAQIIALAEQGKTTAEIIAAGYNKSTVYRQYSEWKKRKAETKKQKAALGAATTA